MSDFIKRWRLAAGLSLAAAVVLWVWLLAFLPVYTAAMGTAAPLLAWLRSVWASSEDMGHGPFLPLVSLYVLFQRRRAIAAAIGRPDGRGLLVALAAAAVFWIGLKTEDVRICFTALVLWTWAIPFALWGAGVARQLVFPAAYLMLCIPIDSLVIFFTMKLRLLAAAVAVGIANGIGIPTVRIGTGIHSTAGAGFNLDVAEACSGLRSVFAMTALAAAYAFFTQKIRWKQWLLFLCAVPVAVLGNIVRIVSITVVAATFGEKAATTFYHDYSGYVIFLIAILALMELGRLISKWRPSPAEAAPPPAPPPGAAFRPGDAVRLAAVPLLLLACGLLVRFEPAIRTGSLDFLPQSLPVEIGAWEGSSVWHCHNEQCLSTFRESELSRDGVAPLSTGGTAVAEAWVSLRDMQPRYRCPTCSTGTLYAASLGEQRQLPGDTRILRSRYSRGGSRFFTVTLVVSGTGRNSIHRPELCIPAQGFVMNRRRTAEAPAGSGGPITVNSVDLERDIGGGRLFRAAFIYWFYSGDRETASNAVRVFWSAWDRAFHHKATRWVMVTVTAEQATDVNGGEMLAFSGALMEQLRNNSL